MSVRIVCGESPIDFRLIRNRARRSSHVARGTATRHRQSTGHRSAGRRHAAPSHAGHRRESRVARGPSSSRSRVTRRSRAPIARLPASALPFAAPPPPPEERSAASDVEEARASAVAAGTSSDEDRSIIRRRKLCDNEDADADADAAPARGAAQSPVGVDTRMGGAAATAPPGGKTATPSWW